MSNYLQLSKKHYLFLTNSKLFLTIKDYFFIDKIKLTSNEIILNACKHAHIEILNWFKNSGLELKYSDGALDWVSKNGHVDVLNWFKNSGFEFKYSDWVINFASRNNHINVLK